MTPQSGQLLARPPICETCGELTLGRLCPACMEHASTHVDNDPYDVVGGEA